MGKKPENEEFLALQASQDYRIAKNLSAPPSSVFPVEVQGCRIHRKGTRIT